MKMKRTLSYFVAIAAVSTLLMSATLMSDKDKDASFKDDFKVTWENTKAYTLQVAEAMPANKFGYKPSEEVRDFGEQFKHVSFTLYYMIGVFLEGKDLPFDPEYINNVALVGGTKQEITTILAQRFDAVAKAVSKMSNKQLQEKVVLPFFNNKEVTKEELLVWVKNHTAHHGSQSVVYLRYNGITPPAYNGW